MRSDKITESTKRMNKTLQPGMTVTIKDNITEGYPYLNMDFTIIDSMKKQQGKQVTISQTSCKGTFRIEENTWWYHPIMIKHINDFDDYGNDKFKELLDVYMIQPSIYIEDKQTEEEPFDMPF